MAYKLNESELEFMNFVCPKCNKNIDNDSKFCKFCGTPIREFNSDHILDKSNLTAIFNGVYESLIANSEYTKEDFIRKFDTFKNYERRVLSDDQYYKMLVDVIFYSGFKASTVDLYLNQIHKNFPDYLTVSNYSQNKIDEIKFDPLMIRNKSKIEACYQNAIKMRNIIEKHGSFKAYIDSFKPNENDNNLWSLKKALQSTFDYLGGKTVYHFMMDIGLNVLKPDRVILRIFNRLGLISHEEDLEGAVKFGRLFSKATGFPIRYIDIIFVMYGQLDQDKLTSICTERNPKCNLCGARQYCNYAKLSIS